MRIGNLSEFARNTLKIKNAGQGGLLDIVYKDNYVWISYTEEVKKRILLGTYALSAGYYDAYYGQALKARSAITKDVEFSDTILTTFVVGTINLEIFSENFCTSSYISLKVRFLSSSMNPIFVGFLSALFFKQSMRFILNVN